MKVLGAATSSSCCQDNVMFLTPQPSRSLDKQRRVVDGNCRRFLGYVHCSRSIGIHQRPKWVA